jgi:3',5'-cyclic AMP phosphodiesterase CpdA
VSEVDDVTSSAASPPPPPLRHATDRRKLRRAEREVRRRLSPTARAKALQLSSRQSRLDLYAWRLRKGSPAVFMPRDPYLSLVQDALEQRIEIVRSEGRAATDPGPPGGPEGADGTSVKLGDELFAQFGPDDFGWMQTVVEAGLTAIDGGKHPFGVTPTEQPLGERARLVLLADWGTGTPRAQRIGALAREWLDGAEPGVQRHVIHLGDVYYCGLPGEYRSRFLNDWPGSAGSDAVSWNLNGNHDMYSGGRGYFGVLAQAPFAQQHGTSCFRLSNDHWQFIGLDTAYLDNDLYDVQLPWLAQWVGVPSSGASSESSGSGTPRTVLLTHHQLGSALAQNSVSEGIRAKTQSVRDTGRVHAWFWGHEHRAFIYNPYLGVQCPVCLGNGGVPELLSHELTLAGAFAWITGLLSRIIALFQRGQHVTAPTIRYQPTTPDVDDDGLKWEKLGFVVVDVNGPSGQAVYIDEDGATVPITSFGTA